MGAADGQGDLVALVPAAGRIVHPEAVGAGHHAAGEASVGIDGAGIAVEQRGNLGLGPMGPVVSLGMADLPGRATRIGHKEEIHNTTPLWTVGQWSVWSG